VRIESAAQELSSPSPRRFLSLNHLLNLILRLQVFESYACSFLTGTHLFSLSVLRSYYELREKDSVRFAESSREYILLSDTATNS
jgi:hypothetical protein